MTKYTNKSNISLPIAIWSLMDNYNHDSRDNVISVTTLLKPIRQIVLGRKYKDCDKEIDAENLIASSMGTALHDSVEKAWKEKDKVIKIMESIGYVSSEALYDEVILERRSEKQVGDYIISGQFDIAFRGTVCDIKSTSVYSHIFGSKDEDYKLQMSIYRWLNQDIIKDDYGYIEYIFTDWSQVKALQDSQYPQKRILSHKIKLLSVEDTETYIINKLYDIAKYEALSDNELLECSDAELWRTEDKYKYYKPNKDGKVSYARATKVFDSEVEANAFKYKNGNVGDIVKYKGEIKRCKYCNYTNICNQYEQFKIKGEI